MTEVPTCDAVHFRRPRWLAGVELVSVCYRERSFPEHSHGEYVVGAVVGGAETLSVRGRSHRVDTGHVLQLHPDEAHANATIGPEALRYRVLYLSGEAIRPFLDCKAGSSLLFPASVSVDPGLFEAVNVAHGVLGCETAGRLEQESALGLLIQTLACASPAGAAPNRLHASHSASVALAKAYIDEHFADGFGLQALADLTGLSIFHFTRSFKRAVGLSPIAYRNQRRLVEARGRLLDGEAIAQVAIDMGYADQSHMTRQFQRIVGASPGQYAQQ